MAEGTMTQVDYWLQSADQQWSMTTSEFSNYKIRIAAQQTIGLVIIVLSPKNRNS